MQRVDNTLHYSFAEVEAKTSGDTLRDVEPKVLVETLANRIKKLKAEKIGETLTDLKATSPVLTLAPTLAEMKAQTAKKVTEPSCPSGNGRHASCRSSRRSGKDN